MIRAAVVLWLVLLWLALWRDVSVANVVGGVLAALVVTAILPSPRIVRRQHRLAPVGVLRFAAYFVWKLLEANVVLAREIVTRRDHLQRGIVAVPLSVRSDLVATIVANAITLTPGTVSLELRREPLTLYVHVLHLRDVEAARREIQRLEELASRAFVFDPAPDSEVAP